MCKNTSGFSIDYGIIEGNNNILFIKVGQNGSIYGYDNKYLKIANNINTPVRQIKAKAELYNGSALTNTYTENDEIMSIGIERVGEESKFFGFGVSQRLSISLRDINREKNINTANSFRISFNDLKNEVCNFPFFKVTEVNRDENTNSLSITAYDALKEAEAHTVSELDISSYTIREFAAAAASLIGATGLDLVGIPDTDTSFDISYPEGANFEGTETIKEALNAVAEATQTIYYLSGTNKLVFKRFSNSAAADLKITKADYITLDSKTNRKLTAITSTTELGDSITAENGEIGTTQFIRDNPFLELREDIGDLIANALLAIGGLTINQFSCSWRGNYLLEIGDKIELVTKDNKSAFSYVIKDTISYNGAFSQSTSWSYTDSTTETANNPANIGEAIKQTFAKVDKVNKQIDIVASETSTNSDAISALQLNTSSLTATVSKMEQQTADALGAATEDIATLKNKVEAQITANDVTLAIEQELANGVDKVTTTTGFTFNDEGLRVSKSTSEMSTQITEDGMKVYKNNEAVLTANNIGVEAVNLQATTYLIIGTNSRLENYGSNRTGCFWIGGNS